MSTTKTQSNSSATEVPQPAAMNRNNPAFLNKLRSMVDDPNTDELIRWSPAGDTFLVPNHVRFGEEVLPRFFKHNNFSSFVRQLNMYGFHKVPHLQQGALKSDQPSQNELWEFSNECFHRDHPDLLSKVQRKRSGKERDHNHSNSTDDTNRTLHGMSTALTRGDYDMMNSDPHDVSNVMGPMQISSLLNAIQGLKNNQRTLVEELSRLQHSSQALWQQSLENRQQVRRQQDTINRILRFLGSVFGSSNVGDILANTNGQDIHTFGMSTDGNSQAHQSQASSDSFAANSSRRPMRPQKRARLFISDTPYADALNTEQTTDIEPGEGSPVNVEHRFTEATSDTENGSPKSCMNASPTSSYPRDSASHTKNNENNSWQLNQSLQNVMMDTNENPAWFSNLLTPQQGQSDSHGALSTAEMPKMDPQLMLALNNPNSQGATNNASATARGISLSNTPRGTRNAGKKNAMLTTVPSFSPYVPGNAASASWPATLPSVAGKNTSMPEEQLIHNVQQLNQEAHDNLDQTDQLENQIQTLVKNLRLEPMQARNFIMNGSVDSKTPPVDTRHTGWTLPSSVSGTTPSPPPPNMTAGGAGPNNSQGDFDLDSFLNQFVDPMNQHGTSFHQGNSPITEDAPDALNLKS